MWTKGRGETRPKHLIDEHAVGFYWRASLQKAREEHVAGAQKGIYGEGGGHLLADRM